MIASARFSFSLPSAILILLLCFAPAALGQGTANGRVASGSIVLSPTLPGLLVFAPHSDHHDKSGCDSRGRDNHNNCASVPEGGTALAYLSLVALGCLATGIFTMRRQARLRETK